MNSVTFSTRIGTFAVLCACATGAGAAQTSDPGRFPVRPIRLILPVPPGGSGDIVGRLIAQALSERLGQSIIVDNRSGAAGLIAADLTARAPADGYTLMLISTSQTQLPAIQKVPYDPAKSHVPIAQIAAGPSSICASPSFAPRNVKELVALARAKPGDVRYASSGTGGVNHFAGELFNHVAKVSITHVPYKGGGPAIIDVIAGRVEIMFGSVLAVLPHVRAGKLKPLGVGSPRRSPLLPDVPTISEAVPGYDSGLWWGIVAPAGVPRPIVNRLNADINAVLRDPGVSKRLSSEAAEPVIVTPEAFGKLISSELEKWRRVAKETGIRAE